MVKVRDWCKFKNGLIVPSRGKSSGLALFWKEGVKLDIQMYSQSHIDALVDGGFGMGWWHLTGFMRILIRQRDRNLDKSSSIYVELQDCHG